MGIFDKVKDEIEESSLNADTILEKLNSKDIDTSELEVSIDEGDVTLEGFVESGKIKNKIAEIVKGIQGVNSVENNLKVGSSDDNFDGDGNKVHVVKRGDTLWGIAQKYYGNGNKYMEIFEANRQVWSDNGQKEDPNILYPDWELVIPEL